MGAAYFYHLARRPLIETLRTLLTKALENDWSVAVRGTDPDSLVDLDRQLWLGPDDGFLPHGLAGQPEDALQPILLTTETQAANAPDCLMAIHGAEVTADEVRQLARVCILFDGRDEAALAQARTQWKVLTSQGSAAQYWSEDSGRWEKKAEA